MVNRGILHKTVPPTQFSQNVRYVVLFLKRRCITVVLASQLITKSSNRKKSIFNLHVITESKIKICIDINLLRI